MDVRQPAPAADAGAAEWIAPRLLADFGAVCRTIPTGFPAYARILHPADPGAARSRRWAEVADFNGKTMHRQAQFASISTPAPEHEHDGGSAEIQAPTAGDLPGEQLAALCRILQPHTPRMSACWFAVWVGWAEFNGDGAAQFDLPGRRYYLFTGVLDDALRIGYWPTGTSFQGRSPNMFWPDAYDWCVASEIDFDSTLVAGSPQLIDDILRSDVLESWPVEPHDSLASKGDTVNQP